MSQEFLPGPLREGGSAPRERLGPLYTQVFIDLSNTITKHLK